MKIHELLKSWPMNGKLEDVTQWSNERYDCTSLTIIHEGQIYEKDFLWDQNNSVYKANCIQLLEDHKGEYVGIIGDLEVELDASRIGVRGCELA